MGYSPVGVTHHGNQQVEHKEGGNDGESKVHHAVHEGQIHIIVCRAVNDSEEQLKSGEQGHGIVVELPKVFRVFCLEDDVKSWKREIRRKKKRV